MIPSPPAPALRSACCSPAKGGQRTLPGRWPCPRGGANRCAAHPAAVAHTWKSPPGQVCAPPGAGPERGVGGARPAGGCRVCPGGRGQDFTARPSGSASRIFLPTLVLFPLSCADWSTRHVGRRVRGKKSAHFSSFLRRQWLFKVLCESALISGLENWSDLFIFGAGQEEIQ